MTETPSRVALLARPGAACDRLQAALRDAGAELVLVADPTDSEPAGISQANAQAVLVALEPSLEDALERFDAVLSDPAITVIFDEAELAAAREGWEAARWVRHLAAKLNRHDDVLPPGAEAPDADIEFKPGRVSLYQRPDGDLERVGEFAGEAEVLADAVPRDRGIDFSAASARAEPDWSMAPMDDASDDGASLVDAAIFAEAGHAPAVDAGATASAPHGMLDEPADDHAASDRFKRDMDDLQQRIASMELVDAPRAQDNSRDGVVLVLAGIGGPDAVRQLLGGLPAQFPRPVLIQQRLDGARHDKLVRQMQRATTMPVQLAEAGEALQRGHVYVLPAGLGVIAGDHGLQFGGDGEQLLAQLPAADSAVILLSGSDPALVDAAMSHAFHGALVAGQIPEGCYDASAPQALIARGAEAGAPAELARKLAARWPA